MSIIDFEKKRQAFRVRVFNVVLALFEELPPEEFKALMLAAMDVVGFACAYTGMSSGVFRKLADEAFVRGAKLADEILKRPSGRLRS